MSLLYVGLMSGTSMDGVDAALVELDEGSPTLLATHFQPMPDPLRDGLADLAAGRNDGVDRVAEMDVQVGTLFADTTLTLLASAGVRRESVHAIGSHGQTIRHRVTGANPFTVQIGDPNIIAERTGITTVADFRRRDVAAGGEGAPLAPAFHNAVFRLAGETRGVLNLGGIANLTVLPATPAAATGFDTGPANVLMDAWASRHLQQPRDENGTWAASGTVHEALLEVLLSDGYFAARPPKSTGREHFHMAWLERGLGEIPGVIPAADVQRTLVELTACTVDRAVREYGGAPERLLVCGGGARNGFLMERLAARLAPVRVDSTATEGVDPEWVEAMAFAWLAGQTLGEHPGNLPAVTGAAHPVVLGGIYRGRT